jgi:putative hydrolase of the HAD superfamily
MVEVLLFDLGGVLVDFSGVREVAPLLPVGTSEANIIERWRRCPHSEAFDRGQLTSHEISERFLRDWNIDLTTEHLLEMFRSWSKCLFPGAVELLDSFRPRFRLAALSNSNELHLERNALALGVPDLFEVTISSHQVGLSKPDPRIYLAALDRLRVSADSVMFFDDRHENIVAASELGIRAFQVDGVEGVRECLVRERLPGRE